MGSFDSDHHSRPEKVPGLQDAVFVAAGGNNTLAIRADGSVWAWGENSAGQLGNEISEATFTPISVEFTWE